MAAVPETYVAYGRHDDGAGEQSYVKKTQEWLRNEERKGNKKKAEAA